MRGLETLRDPLRLVVDRRCRAGHAAPVHGRAIDGGVAIGVASLLAPIYIAEISPARVRGRLVALNQMAIMSGILLAYLVNWGLSFQGTESWRWMFAVAAVPSLFFLVALFLCPRARAG